MIKELLKALVLFTFFINSIKIYGNYHIFNQDTTKDFPYLIDLRNIISPPIVLIAPPDPDKITRMGPYHLLNTTDGYAIFTHEEPCLWKLSQGHWQRMSLPNSYTPLNIFALSDKDLWIVCMDNIPYKNYLLHYNGKGWEYFLTPNSDGIRDLDFLSSTSGWAVGDWGQIMRYFDKKWEIYHCPTPYHINKLIMLNDSLGYARTDIPWNVSLKYNQANWKIYQSELSSLEEITVYADNLVSRDENIIKNEIAYFQNISNQNSIKSDTLQLNFNLPSAGLIWSSRRGSIRFYPNYGYLYYHNDKSFNRVLTFILPLKTEIKNNWCYQPFLIISQQKVESRLVLKLKLTNFQEKSDLKLLIIKNTGSAFEHGICVADFSGDGIEDLYVVATNVSNRLYIQPPKDHPVPHQMIEIADKAGVVGPTMINNSLPNYDEGTSCADIDNDGDQDILVTSLYGPNMLFKQIRPTYFVESAQALNLSHDYGRTCSGIWGDINNDGYLDLFVSNEDSTNHLYLNNGAGIFRDVTKEIGLFVSRGGTGSSFADIDGDGDLDLFVPRYGARNLLFRNDLTESHSNKAYFAEVGQESGVSGSDSLARSSCGIFGDVDNDGDLDLFVTNLNCSNWLYLNDGKGQFTDVTINYGLWDSSLSQTAAFYDADNDGDLDLVVGNRGESYFYENTGNRLFKKRRIEFPGINIGSVSGMAVFDQNDDGNLELYIGDSFSTSHILRNEAYNSNYIKIKLKGTISNQDAIGAKAFLYNSGSIGVKSHLVGMREVNGGCGYNSMSSKTIHFGVPDGLPCDILIVFPSGVQKKVCGNLPGQTILIFEETGISQKISQFKKWYIRNAFNPANQKEILFVVIFFICLMSLNYYLSKQNWWQSRIIFITAFIPMLIFLLLFTILAATNLYLRHIVSFAFGAGALVIGFFYGRKLSVASQNKFESLEKLFISTSAFFHGEWGARNLNRLQFFCSNLEIGHKPSLEVQERLGEAINSFFSLIVPELERILSYAQQAEVSSIQRNDIKSNMLALSNALSDLAVEIRTIKGVERRIIQTILERSKFLNISLRNLRNSITEQFSCNVYKVILNTVQNLPTQIKEISFQKSIPGELIGRIRPGEFSQIMDNLIQNSLRAIEGKKEKLIHIIMDANSDTIFVRVSDNGHGVSPLIRDKLFLSQINSDSKGSGFGLYNSHKILQKYGGLIRLLQTGNGDLTIFEVQIRRVDNAS